MANKIPFDLALWKTGEYRLFSGDVEIETICVADEKNRLPNSEVAAYPIMACRRGCYCRFSIEGQFFLEFKNTAIDLYLVKKTKKVYANILEKDVYGEFYLGEMRYIYRTDAEQARTHSNYIMTIEVEL